VTPTVAPTAEVGRAGAAVFMERDGHFFDAKPAQGGFDNHLTGEFHAGGAEIHFVEGLFGESAKAAVEIVGRAAEEESTDEGQGRVADPSVCPRHGAGNDLSTACRHTAAHDEVGTGAEFLDEGFDFGKVVAVVRVAHDEESSLGGFHSGSKGIAVAFFGDIDNAGTELAGYVLGSIGAAVVGDEDFALDSGICKPTPGCGDAIGQRFSLIEAGHENRDFHFETNFRFRQP